MATSHENKKTYECELCGGRFSSKWYLNTHKKSVHEEKKPFKCVPCDVKFVHKRQLTGHINLVHVGRELFKCDFCGASSSKKGDLNRHIASVHEVKKPFKMERDKPETYYGPIDKKFRTGPNESLHVIQDYKWQVRSFGTEPAMLNLITNNTLAKRFLISVASSRIGSAKRRLRSRSFLASFLLERTASFQKKLERR